MRLVVLAVANCLLAHGTWAAQAEVEHDVIRRLSSEDLAERREAAQSLGPEKIGSLEPELAVRAILMAAQDSDPTVREWALGGLAILAAVVAAGNTNPEALAFGQVIHASRELRPMLERIVLDDQCAGVALAASAPFMALYGSDPAAEAMLLDRVDREPDIFERLRLLSSLEIGGIDGELTFERLARYLDGAPMRIQTKAAHLLLSAKILPRDRFEDFLRLIESPEAFADPMLVHALPRFGVAPEEYLPRLLALQPRLEEELQKPRDERTLSIYNDEYWKQTLDEAIAAAREGIQANQQ